MSFSSFPFRAGMALLLLALFCRMLGVFILLPVAAPLAMALPDGSPFLAGLVLGGYGLTQAALQIPIGLLADRIGKKQVMLAALAVFAAGGFVASAADSTLAMVGGRLLQGAGAVAAVTAAWMADLAPAQRRAPAMAALGAVIALAFLLSLFAAPQVAAVLGLNGVFAFSGWLGVAALACVLLLPPPQRAAARQAATVRADLHALLRNRTLQVTASGAFVLHAALALLFFTVPSELPLPPTQHWQAYAPALALAALPAWMLITRIERHTVVCLRIAVLTLCLGLFALSALTWHFPSAVLALFAFFVGFVVLEAALPALTAKGAPAAMRTSAMGVMMSCQFAGMFCGAALAGGLERLENTTSLATIATCLMLALWQTLAARALGVVECPPINRHKEE